MPSLHCCRVIFVFWCCCKSHHLIPCFHPPLIQTSLLTLISSSQFSFTASSTSFVVFSVGFVWFCFHETGLPELRYWIWFCYWVCLYWEFVLMEVREFDCCWVEFSDLVFLSFEFWISWVCWRSVGSCGGMGFSFIWRSWSVLVIWF